MKHLIAVLQTHVDVIGPKERLLPDARPDKSQWIIGQLMLRSVHTELNCGIDLHARRMYVCILHPESAILLHRHMPASPETFLKAIAP